KSKKRSNESDTNVYELTKMATPISIKKQRKTYTGEQNCVKVDLKKHSALKNYCTLIFGLQLHHVEESVVNCEIFIQVGWDGNHSINTISTPRIRINPAFAAFKEHPNKQFNSIESTLWSLCDKSVICSWEISLSTFIRWIYHKGKNYFDIDNLTVISVILAIILYRHTPCRSVGSSPSESHVKIELWAKLFLAIFALYNLKFLPTWELQHLISENAGRVHKDNVVVVTEAVHEFNKILSLVHYPTEDEINNIWLHTALIYINEEILTLNLNNIDVENNVGNALRLATYLRETVCASGDIIRSLLNREPIKFDYDLRAVLPKLPREAVKPREFKTKFTPQDKRKLYSIYTIFDVSEVGEYDTF
ncbi:19470_t:CDS:2, partial [Gigaspora margarita]